jgi:hypothetical protein
VTTLPRTMKRYARPGLLAGQESRSISGSPSLNLGGLEAMDAILHAGLTGQARKAWLEVRGEEK